MDYAFSPEDEAFRADVRAFLKEALPSDWAVRRAGDDDGDDDSSQEFQEQFHKRLAEKGWLVVSWPKEYGGQEWSYLRQVVFSEEIAYHQAPKPDGIATRMVGSLLIAHGTDEQKRRFLPPIANADVKWCQLFSEPNAGSDLASLSTTAEDQGDYFLLNGSKVWSSFAHLADWGFLLARTNTEAPKHKGLSYFFLDMTLPGIVVRPLISMVGVHRFNQVFFDNVRIPRDCLVGGKDEGWTLSTSVLNVERSGVTAASSSSRMLEEMIAFANDSTNGVRWTPELRHRMADLFTQVSVARNQSYRIAWMQTEDIQFSHEASVNKLFTSELSQRIAQFGMDLMGLYGQVQRGDSWSPLRGKIERNYKTTVASTIAGGTSEIQRNVIAKRGLGLGR
ncbi:MAG: acyl-CoA dehydrogenase family protein [Chloroflexi bacterium]|nr:acyl-CoA dehydrogenase family protein [Chloroflexota bacterium]